MFIDHIRINSACFDAYTYIDVCVDICSDICLIDCARRDRSKLELLGNKYKLEAILEAILEAFLPFSPCTGTGVGLFSKR